MSFRKFANAVILDARMGTDTGFAKNAHRAVFDYTPREGYLYVRSRAISSRCNDNFDMFPAEEIEKSYLTFIGKPVFVNHHNEDHRRARGVIIDAALHKDRNPDGSPDTWAEVLMEVDAVRFPRLAKAIIAGEVDRTSMGCDVQLSKCSVCGNEATSPLQYCAHIPGKKGKKIYKLDPRTGEKKAQLVFEICSGLSFFENSLLVEAPADPTAFFLGNVEVGPGLEHLTAGMNKTASLHPYAWNPEGRTEPFSFQEGAEFQRQNFQGNTMFDAPTLNVWSLLKQAATEPMNPNGYVWTSDMQSDKIQHLLHEASATGDDLFDWDFVVTAVRPDKKNPGVIDYSTKKPLTKMTDDEKKAHFHEVGRSSYLQARSSGATTTPNYHPEKKTSEMSDEEKEDHYRKISHVQGVADNWIDKHPVHANNIVKSWSEASEDHKAQGRNWYPDANAFSHTAARLINQHREGTGQEPLAHHQVAGLIGVYSPQAEWHSNLHVALHAGRTGTAIGGGKEKSKIPVSGDRTTGSFTSESQARQASAILGGMHYDSALAPTSHKVRNFSHLIEHGSDDHSVVVDRHASSVAHGARVPDFVFDHGVMPKLSTKGGYEQYANAYRTATKKINKTEEHPVQPHMVQAATWLHQQSKNNADGRRGKNASAAFSKFKDYIGEVYPHDAEELLRAPGTGHAHNQHGASLHVAYGETKSPEDVDTLRSENCTVCGNSSAWDGTQCQVCGYVAPPRPFGDPNTDIAQQKDIRKQVLDGNEADPNDPNQQLGQQLGNPEELQDQQDAAAAGEDTQLGTLTCNVCGTGVQPAPPTSESGGEPAYPAEGDVCPVCKKGQLLGEGAGEDPGAEGLGDEAEMDSADAEEGQEGNAPGGANQQELEEDDGDEQANEEFKGKQDDSDDDDQDDGDSFDPKKKADKEQKTSSFVPVWWKPSWWRG